MAVPSIREVSRVKKKMCEENNKAKGYGNPPQGRIHFIGSYKCSSSNWVMSDVLSSSLLPLTEKHDGRPRVQKSAYTYSDALLP